MSRPCPTCDGDGVIRSEETIEIVFERRLRDIAAEHADDEAFLVQINPRVTAEFTRNGSRVLHALEHDTGKSFLFEGSEGLPLDHFAITFQGTRAEVEDRALPFRQGDEVLVEIVEPHMYAVDDAVAKIDGYIISIAGGAAYVGEKRLVRIEEVGRTAASALLLDESGEVIPPPVARPAAAASRRRRGGRGRSTAAASERAAEPVDDGQTPAAETVVESSDDGAPPDDGKGDGLQSKPRRRGRRGGRRRSAAKTAATPK